LLSEIQLNKRKNFPALDWVRAAAALSVFFHHFYQQYLSEGFNETSYFGAFMANLGSWGGLYFFCFKRLLYSLGTTIGYFKQAWL
jgi:peptidoglycan/LPS O-acetylase OafA/YrhL